MRESDRDGSERRGIFYVVEREPEEGISRWYCHWDGETSPEFSLVDDAVAWGLDRAETVLVRTLQFGFYWAGVPPEESPSQGDLHAWPPDPHERQLIDSTYRAALMVHEEDSAARNRYLVDCERWLAHRAPGVFSSGPIHRCLIALPYEQQDLLELEEFDIKGLVCGARRQRSTVYAFGTTDVAIGTAAGLPLVNEWVQAVCRALDRDRRSPRIGRRATLDVQVGRGEMFHVTASVNRDSVLVSGLDWRLMSTPGISGNSEPEAEAIFVCQTLRDAEFFVGMARVPTDVWTVRVDGLWIENGPAGWHLIAEPVPRERLALVRRNIAAGGIH
jgi:hypothetical protein